MMMKQQKQQVLDFSFVMVKLLSLFLLVCNLLPTPPAVFVTGQRTDPCYVCRRSDRYITNQNQQFELTDIYGNTFTWTCGKLEEKGMEIRVSNTVCGIYVAHAEAECDCGGPPIPAGYVKNENPLCDICIDGRAVPSVKKDDLVDTGVAGEMPCGFLYESSATGFMPQDICPIIQQNVAEYCCTIPAVDTDGDDGNGNGNGNGNGGSSGGTSSFSFITTSMTVPSIMMMMMMMFFQNVQTFL